MVGPIIVIVNADPLFPVMLLTRLFLLRWRFFQAGDALGPEMRYPVRLSL